jgi:hypothetical protein
LQLCCKLGGFVHLLVQEEVWLEVVGVVAIQHLHDDFAPDLLRVSIVELLPVSLVLDLALRVAFIVARAYIFAPVHTNCYELVFLAIVHKNLAEVELFWYLPDALRRFHASSKQATIVVELRVDAQFHHHELGEAREGELLVDLSARIVIVLRYSASFAWRSVPLELREVELFLLPICDARKKRVHHIALLLRVVDACRIVGVLHVILDGEVRRNAFWLSKQRRDQALVELKRVLLDVVVEHPIELALVVEQTLAIFEELDELDHGRHRMAHC